VPRLRLGQGALGAITCGVAIATFGVFAARVRARDTAADAPIDGAVVPTGRLRISEVHYHPSRAPNGIDSEDAEFVEIVNLGGDDVDASGARLCGAVRFVFPAGARIAAHATCVVARDPRVFRVLRPTFAGEVAGPYDGKLDNAGQRLELRAASGEVLDVVEYDDVAPWPLLADGDGHSLERVAVAARAENPSVWRASERTGGSPGQASLLLGAASEPTTDRAVDEEPPWIVDARPEELHGPCGYRPGAPVVIGARVAAPREPIVVELLSQALAPGDWFGRVDERFALSWQRRSMERGADGVYRAALGPFAPRTFVRWRVEVRDGRGFVAHYPCTSDPSPNGALFVAEPSEAPAPTRTVCAENGGLPIVSLIAREVDIAAAFGTRRGVGKAYRWDAALVVGGRAYDHVRWRLHGHATRFEGGKRSLKIRLARGQQPPAAGGSERAASERVSPESAGAFFGRSHRDLELAAARQHHGLAEVLASEVFRPAGIPVPDLEYVTLHIVSTSCDADDFFGLYLLREDIDRKFLARRGLADAALFEVAGGPVARYATREDRADVRELLARFRSGTDCAELADEIDVERYVAFRAAVELTELYDLGSANHYLVRERGTAARPGPWCIWPSDLNGAFGVQATTSHDLLSNALLGCCRDRISTRIVELAASGALTRGTERLASIATSIDRVVARDRERWPNETYSGWQSTARAAGQYLTRRLEERARSFADGAPDRTRRKDAESCQRP